MSTGMLSPCILSASPAKQQHQPDKDLVCPSISRINFPLSTTSLMARISAFSPIKSPSLRSRAARPAPLTFDHSPVSNFIFLYACKREFVQCFSCCSHLLNPPLFDIDSRHYPSKATRFMGFLEPCILIPLTLHGGIFHFKNIECGNTCLNEVETLS